MNLFDQEPDEALDGPDAPLAARMRPRTLDEFAGQETILGPGKILRRMIEQDELRSAIFFGPPGCGKSTLAFLIAKQTKAHFETMSAVMAGVADVRRAIESAKLRRQSGTDGANGRTILFIDEIHRFNKSQQDALLPHVEDGTVTLIGATTENPFFELNGPLLSRSKLFRFEALGVEDIRGLVIRALSDCEVGLGSMNIQAEDDALAHIVAAADGDARFALTALEWAALAAEPDGEGRRQLTVALAEEAVQRRVLAYDRAGDQHYDVISAFIKSMRGSDPDAAVYWLHRMLAAGEDPRFIMRRVVIHASEDVGMADPQALVVAVSAAHALDFIGLPEAELNMTQAVIHVATAPKSNAVCVARDRAKRDVSDRPPSPVPVHLRSTAYKGAAKLGHGVGYKYPHDYPEAFVDQQYVEEGATSGPYYEPKDQGYEAKVAARMAKRKGGRTVGS
jgi:putative ATPase